MAGLHWTWLDWAALKDEVYITGLEGENVYY